jgi:hypothetical protein
VLTLLTQYSMAVFKPNTPRDSCLNKKIRQKKKSAAALNIIIRKATGIEVTRTRIRTTRTRNTTRTPVRECV